MSLFSSLTSTTQFAYYTPITGSALIKTGAGVAIGIIVSSHTNGTIKLWDNTAGSGSVCVDTYTYAAGSQTIPLFGAKFTTGLYADVGGTTQKATIVWN